MSTRTIDDQLVSYLKVAHSLEEQALAQLRMAPRIAHAEPLARAFREHLGETEGHERMIRERLEHHGHAPSRVQDAVFQAGGVGFALFARLQPDSPGKLVAHAYSYESFEAAAYEVLLRVAKSAGDEATADVARRILEQERAMAGRLAELFDVSVQASLEELNPDSMQEQLNKYLADAHAIETQAIQLLERSQRIAGDRALETLYGEHLRETEGQLRLIERRLQERGGHPSRIKDAAMRLGALNWGMLFQVQPDTPAKLAVFAYAFEHLEIGAYEQLERVAGRIDDTRTVELAREILAQERQAASKIESHFDAAVAATLEAREVAV